jgi:hypothetical protein
MGSRHNQPRPKRGRHGDPKGLRPNAALDAFALLVIMANKARDIRTTRGGKDMPRSSRSKDGQLTNYAGFGDQYFRLKSSLVREVRAMDKAGPRLAYPTWTPEDRERLRLYREATAILAAADEAAD